MMRFVSRKDLDVIEIVECAHGAAPCVPRGGVVGECWYYVEGFEHVACDVGGVGSRGDSERDVLRFCAVQD